MRLNLGCGDRYVDGWVNVDFESPHKVDERVDLTGPLPWGHGNVSHAYAGHLFEHLRRDQCLELARQLLPCMDRRGAVLMVVGPDMQLARGMFADGSLDTRFHTLDSIIHGGSRWPGDDHKWETTGHAVAELLREAGWPVVSSVGIDAVGAQWPVADREPRWQFAVRAWTGETS